MFVMYAVASMLPVVVLGAVLMLSYHQQALEQGREQGRAQAGVIQEMVIAPTLHGPDLTHIGVLERKRLQQATELAIFNGSLAGLRLRAFTGEVIYSDGSAATGALAVSDPAFRAAAEGGTDVAVVRDPFGTTGPVIRVVQPVATNANGQASGVLELYLPYEAIDAMVRADLRRTAWVLAGGLAGLYVVLALISSSNTRVLRRHAAQHEHDALHDGLTGLPNRDWFRTAAEDAVERGRRGETGALVLVDLDHFKEVNDTLGHRAGDDLLRVVGDRLRGALRADDTVARLGGDEFGLILPRVTDRASTLVLLAAVRDRLTETIVLDSVPIGIEASFGVAFYPDDAATVEDLLQCADAAMYQGKRGTSGIIMYEPAVAAHPSSLLLQQDLRRALDGDELVLHYQPKITLATGAVSGVEALIRWDHPERGLLQPADFLPAAERSGLINPLTDWVLRRALTDHAGWTAMGMDWPVAVNVSARNLESLAFPASVAAVLSSIGAGPGRLHLEVTETALAVDVRFAARVVAALAHLGIPISVDDFGIGYTSLSQLRTLAVAEVKIDRTFVAGLEHNDADRAIVRSVIGLGHGIGCRVTAEGVETEPIARWLAEAGCDDGQGYFFARPAPWLQLVEQFGRTVAR